MMMVPQPARAPGRFQNPGPAWSDSAQWHSISAVSLYLKGAGNMSPARQEAPAVTGQRDKGRARWLGRRYEEQGLQQAGGRVCRVRAGWHTGALPRGETGEVSLSAHGAPQDPGRTRSCTSFCEGCSELSGDVLEITQLGVPAGWEPSPVTARPSSRPCTSPGPGTLARLAPPHPSSGF